MRRAGSRSVSREDDGRAVVPLGDDGYTLVVVEYRHLRIARGEKGTRNQIRGAWTELLTGETLRFIDAETLELISTGELIKGANRLKPARNRSPQSDADRSEVDQ
jgi:hypothetical protein